MRLTALVALEAAVMYPVKVFPTFAKAAESARWIAQRVSSDVVVRHAEDGWTLEIEALRKIEEAFLRDLMVAAISESREDLIPVVDQSGEWPVHAGDPDRFAFDGDSVEAVNDQWNSGEFDWTPDTELGLSASG
jgi:hypothetical protein